MKKFLFALIFLCWLSLPAVAQQDSAAASEADGSAQPVASESTGSLVEAIVAQVNDSIITRDQLQRNRAQTEMDAREMKLPPAEIAERKKNALRDLIDQQLLIQKAAELGISADADLIQRLDDLRKQMKVDSIEELQKLAESQGVPWEEFKENSKNGILAQKVIASEVGGRIHITQEDVQRYYDEHKEQFTQPARVRLSEILIEANPDALPGSLVDATEVQVDAAREKILKIYNELKAGANFAELAKTESNGSTAEQGGDLGYFKHNDLAQQLEELTFNLKPGQFTQPIQTRQGFIILLVTDRTAEGAPSVDRVRGQIQDIIYSERIQPALRIYLARLRREAYIDVRPGYIDTGAVAPESELTFSTSSGPKTKEVSGPLGLGKKTVLVDDTETDEAEADMAAATKMSSEKEKEQKAKSKGSSGATSSGSAAGIVSELDAAKANVASAQRALDNSKTPEQRAKAQAAFDAAEKEMLSHMSSREKKQYFKDKKKNAEKEAKRRQEENEQAKERADRKALVRAAKAQLVAAQKALEESTTEKEAATARKAIKNAEEEMLRNMSSSESKRYLKQKEKAEEQASREREEAQKKEAKKQDEKKEEAKKEDAENNKPDSGDGSAKADASSTEPKKKKFSWF